MESFENIQKNPALAKIGLLVKGVHFPRRLYLKPNEAYEKYFYDSTKCGGHNLPSEIILPNDIVSNIFPSEESPFSIVGRKLYLKGEELFDITFTNEAKFLSHHLSDGTPASQIASMYGLDVLSIFLNRTCAYFGKGYGCKFCSIDYTRKTFGKNNSTNPQLSQVKEILEIALKPNNHSFSNILISSGAYSNPDKGITEQMGYIGGMKQINNQVKYHLVTIPPKSDELLYMLSKEGPDTVSFDLEVFNPVIFKNICPGKEKQIKYGEWLRIFEKCSRFFPKNKVKIGFVCGLESLDTLVEGMEFVGKLGLVPAVNIFHPDQGTPFAGYPRPSSQFILDTIREQTKIYKKYGLVPVFPKFGRRSSLDTEIYRGFFDEIFN